MKLVGATRKVRAICAKIASVLLRFWLTTGLVLGAIPQGNSFRFAIVGDRTGETVPGVYEQVWREIGKESPGFVLNAGDTIQGLKDATAESEWRQVKPVWTRLRLPFFLVPGNHDIWSDASQAVYEKETGRKPSYGFDWQNAHFTVLDNSRSLQLSAAQMAFLESDLAAHRNRQPKFVVFHQPFWLLPLKLGNTDFLFHKLMKQYGVSAVISGHVHQLSRMERDGVTYLVVGSSGGHLRGHNPVSEFDKGWFFHHLEVQVTGETVQMTVKETGAPFGKGRSFNVRQWGEFGGVGPAETR